MVNGRPAGRGGGGVPAMGEDEVAEEEEEFEVER